MAKILATIESSKYSVPALKLLVEFHLAEMILYHHNEVKVEVKEVLGNGT